MQHKIIEMQLNLAINQGVLRTFSKKNSVKFQLYD